MDKIYMFGCFAFLTILFYGYGGFNPVTALLLTAFCFGISVIGFIAEEHRNISLLGKIENINKEKSL